MRPLEYTKECLHLRRCNVAVHTRESQYAHASKGEAPAYPEKGAVNLVVLTCATTFAAMSMGNALGGSSRADMWSSAP